MKSKLYRVTDWPKTAHEANYNVENLAALCGVTKRTLETHFLRTTRLTPHEWMRQLRLMNACLMVLGGRHSIKEIAYASGYRQPSHFSSDFTAFFGLPPSEISREGRRSARPNCS